MQEMESPGGEQGRLCSNAERFTTSAFLGDVRIPKHELLRERVLMPVHLRPDDAKERLRVNQHLDPVLLDHLVKLPRLVNVFEVVRQAGASPIADSDPDQLRIR